MAGARRRRRWQQLDLDTARRPSGRGGWRPGAGRPRGAATVSHATRAPFRADTPLHVTLRMVGGLRSLRNGRAMRVVHAALAAAHRPRSEGVAPFGVVQFSVQGNHVHLIVEARDRHALSRGMHGLAIRLARRLNAVLDRHGALFAHRYHARALRTPREVRSALRYVLLNARHHAAQRGHHLASRWLDPCSSAPWFDGWREPVRADAPWLTALARAPCPCAPARTWLLTTGWRRHGLLARDEVPGDHP